MNNSFRHSPAVTALLIFVAFLPILVFPIGTLYNTVLLQVLKNEVAAIPVYPSATLVKTSFSDEKIENSPGRVCTWLFQYDTGGQREALISYYEKVLPALGWTNFEDASVADVYYAYSYSKSNGLLTISGPLQGNDITNVSVTYNYSVQLDLLRYYTP